MKLSTSFDSFKKLHNNMKVINKHKLHFVKDDGIWRIRRTNCSYMCDPPWIDIFIMKKNKDNIYINQSYLYDNNGYNKTKISSSELYPLKKAKFNNILVNIPNKYEIILERLFGSNWKIPIPAKPHSVSIFTGCVIV